MRCVVRGKSAVAWHQGKDLVVNALYRITVFLKVVVAVVLVVFVVVVNGCFAHFVDVLSYLVLKELLGVLAASCPEPGARGPQWAFPLDPDWLAF